MKEMIEGLSDKELMELLLQVQSEAYSRGMNPLKAIQTHVNNERAKRRANG